MTVALTPSPFFTWFTPQGQPAVGYQLSTYVAGTSIPQATYTDSTQTQQNTNPVILNSAGYASVWLVQGLAYKFVLQDQSGNPVWSQDQIPGGQVLTAQIIGALIYPQIQAELNASITPNTTYNYGDIRRYGVVPNIPASANSNSIALQTLLNPSIANGPTGRIYFPNTTGADIYYFAALYHQIRDGVHLDLQECTLNFSGPYVPSFNGFPFLACIRDVNIENGNITVNYNGASGAGTVIQIGNRYNSIPWATYTTGILDQDNLFANSLPLQGNCVLRNLRISSNNPGSVVIFCTGDISNTVVENVWIDCQNQGYAGIDGEFGFASVNGQPGTASMWTSSHAQNLSFRNIHIDNVITGASNSAFGYRGAWSLVIDGLYVNGADVGAAFSAGEAFYYRPWVRDTASPLSKPFVMLRDINCLNIGTGVTFQGAANGSSGSYLSPVLSLLSPPASYLAFTDLMSLFMDGFTINAAEGVSILGAAHYDIRNGTIFGNNNASTSGGIIISQEAILGSIENVRISYINGEGIRADFASAIWSPVRPKVMNVRRCRITQCNPTGIGVVSAGRVLIEDNILGASTLYDGVLDTIQTGAVQVASGTSNVTCDSNYVAVASGGTAYTVGGSTSANCNLKNPMGIATTSGNWDVDGVAARTSTQMNSKTDVVNTIGKYTGKLCQSTSINKMFIAQGGVNTSTWISTDGVTTITPS